MRPLYRNILCALVCCSLYLPLACLDDSPQPLDKALHGTWKLYFPDIKMMGESYMILDIQGTSGSYIIHFNGSILDRKRMKYFDYPKLTGHIVHIKLEQNADGNEYYNLLVTPTNSGIQDADIRLFKNTDGTVQMSNQFALAGKGEFSKFNEILGPEYYEFLGPGRNKVHPIIFKKVSD